LPHLARRNQQATLFWGDVPQPNESRESKREG
jgi:hypothetical protein